MFTPNLENQPKQNMGASMEKFKSDSDDAFEAAMNRLNTAFAKLVEKCGSVDKARETLALRASENNKDQ